MRKFIFLLLFMVICHLNSFGQKEAYNWYMGNSTAFNFGTDPPNILTNCAITWAESCVSMSDSAGNLLFYSDGGTVWNKNHQIMSNGNDLMGHKSTIYGTGTMKVGINKYMIVTVDAIEGNKNGLRYHIIDMTGANGLGTLTQKNVQVYDGITPESMIVISHADSNKFWIITANAVGDTLMSFLVTDSTVSTTPVKTGALHISSHMHFRVSVNGDKVVLRATSASWLMDIYDFDQSTGIFSNGITINSDYAQPYDFAFSHDGKYLYAVDNRLLSPTVRQTKLMQFDITAGSGAAIASSKVVLYDSIVSSNKIFQGLSLGPDKKIYVSRSGSKEVGVIESPYLKGAACNYKHNGLTVRAKPFGVHDRFPAFCGIYLPSDDIFEYENKCPGDTVKFNMISWINCDSFRWVFDDPSSLDYNYSKDTNSFHVYNKSGIYNVAFVRYRFGRSDTIFREVEIFNKKPIDLGPDTFYCDGSPISVDYREFMPSSFRWSHGLTQPQITYYGSGEYWLEVTDTNGCVVADTIEIDKKPAFSYRGTRDFLRCDRDTLLLDVGVGADIYKWSNGDTGSTVKLTTTDKYYVEFTLGDCITNDSFTVEFKPVPIFDFGRDTVICNTDSIILSGTSGVKHFWNVGDTTQNITIKTAGEYILKQSTQYCDYSDTINISVQQQPNLFIGNDTVVCVGAKVIMGATIPNGIQYTWNNRGDATPKITTDSQSIYSVIAYDGVCRAYDTMFVGVYTPQSIELGQDSTLCAGTATLLDAAINRGEYLWNDGVQTPTRLITQSGNYSVLVTDSVCQYSDAITITFNPVPDLDLGSDTFLCQDEVHQVFVNPQWESVLWQDGNSEYSRIFTTEGKYLVTADYLNCQSTDSITINYYPPLPTLDLGADQDVCDPLFYPLQANYNGYYPLIWNIGTTGNYLEVTKTGDYIVSTAPHRCGQVSDTIHITFLKELCDLHVPTAFSPNGDGRNDTFFPIGYQAEVENMRIYNRWGELLYDGEGPWDGTYKGESVPAGNYLYIITYKKEHRGGKKRVFTKGTVQVIR